MANTMTRQLIGLAILIQHGALNTNVSFSWYCEPISPLKDRTLSPCEIDLPAQRRVHEDKRPLPYVKSHVKNQAFKPGILTNA